MTKDPSHFKAYSLIKKNRIIRKINTYKLALSVVIDKTIAIYLLVIGVYVLASFFIASDFIDNYDENFLIWEKHAVENIWTIFTAVPLAFIIQSFRNPGVVFSSSEYQLSLLPYSRGKIWLLPAVEKWIKQFFSLMIVGLFIIIITPISPLVVVGYMGLFIFLNVLMTIPQWKLFQTRMFTKICWLVLLMLMNVISFLTNPHIIAILFMIMLIFLNLWLKQTLFDKVKWDLVTEISDFQIWSMWFISKVSEVEIKRQKKYSIFQKIFRRKKPFKYNEKSILRTLWFLYLRKNIQHIGKIIGALLVLLFVFSWIDGIVFHIVLAVSFYIYMTVVKSCFLGRFKDDIVEVLPWNVIGYKHTFFNWALLGGLLVFIPIGIYLAGNISVWVPLQLIYYFGTFLYLYHVNIDKAISLLRKKFLNLDIEESIGYLLLAGIIFSWNYKSILFVSLIIPFLIRKRVSNQTSAHY